MSFTTYTIKKFGEIVILPGKIVSKITIHYGTKMKKYFFVVIIMICAMKIAAQNQQIFEKLADTEKSFAQVAAQKNVREAFLEFLTADAVIFAPTIVNGREYFNARPATPALLSWYPIFIDASANGVFGYTTGRGEFRPQGKDDSTVFYSDYLTVWRRQSNGEYKAVIDVGARHDKPLETDRNWKFPSESSKNPSENIPPASASVNLFYDTATAKNLTQAYKIFASENVRFLREGKQPLVGKKIALSEFKKDKQTIVFGKNMTLQSAGDLAYAITAYSLKNGEAVEKGNTIQVWKFIGGKWQIVADVFAPIPEK